MNALTDAILSLARSMEARSSLSHIAIVFLSLLAVGAQAQERPTEPRSWHLLTQTEGGTVSLIKDDLTKHECEFAMHRALGQPATDEEIASAKRAADKRAQERKATTDAWEAAHPECAMRVEGWRKGFDCLPSSLSTMLSASRLIQPSDIKTAECFQ